MREGVYAGLSGPSFESPADLRFLRVAGADAVGMSTVSEVIVARHGGTRVLGFSGISNKANLDGNTVTSHEEVLAAGRTDCSQVGKNNSWGITFALVGRMTIILKFFNSYSILIYLLLVIGLIFSIRGLAKARHEMQGSLFGLERETAHRHVSQAVAGLALVIFIGGGGNDFECFSGSDNACFFIDGHSHPEPPDDDNRNHSP